MRVSGELLFNGALVAGIAALIYSRNIYLNSPLRATPVTEYTSLVAPDVFVRPSYFSIVKGDKTATSTFLVRHGRDHILIDAGSPGRDEHAFDLTAAVGKIIGNGSLPLLLLTHGHIDHVGAIPELVEAFPELQVVFHSLEAPYVTGLPILLTGAPSKYVCTVDPWAVLQEASTTMRRPQRRCRTSCCLRT